MTSHKLDRIRIQTARMVEIYSLLRREIDCGVPLTTEHCSQLQRAIDTIVANMEQLQSVLATEKEDTSTATSEETSPPVVYPGIGELNDNEAHQLEEIVSAVLQWHAETIGANENGE